jgi:hypothetical protein
MFNNVEDTCQEVAFPALILLPFTFPRGSHYEFAIRSCDVVFTFRHMYVYKDELGLFFGLKL